MTRAPGVTAIVLAGGRSTRFGGPKLQVEIQGQPLLERAIEAAATVANIVIVAGAAAPATGSLYRVGGVAIRSVLDEEAFAGPLAAVAGALREVTTGLAVVVGGDMPALVPAVLQAMLARLASNDTIDAVLLAAPVPAVGAEPTEPPRRQVLPLAIDVAKASAAARRSLATGDRSLVRLLDRLRVEELPAGEWLVLDPTGRTLLDVDRPFDVLRIRNEMR